MAELGIISAKGRNGTAELVQVIANAEDDRLPPVARFCLEMLARQYAALTAEIGAVDKRIHAWHRSCEQSRRLEEIPGIGPIVATALVAEIGDWKQFRSGRSLARLDWVSAEAAFNRRQGQAWQYHQAGQSLFAMASRPRCDGRHSLCSTARHQAALAHADHGPTTYKGRCCCSRQ